MMTLFYVEMLMLSDWIPVLATALARGRKNRAFAPFIYKVIFDAVVDWSSHFSIILFRSNTVISNIYTPVNVLLILWLFRRWSGRRWDSPLYVILLTILMTLGVVESTVRSWNQFGSTLAVASSLVFVYLAINTLNRLIATERGSLIRNAKFFICAGLVLFHTMQILSESFYVFPKDHSDQFLASVFAIQAHTNVVVNLIFAYAILQIPRRERFSMAK